MAGPRVLIAGVANPFGARLVGRLTRDETVERVVGVDTRPVAEDRALLLEPTDEIRAPIQQKVYDSLVNGEGGS